jgi:disulfide bond formation protein DsbB
MNVRMIDGTLPSRRWFARLERRAANALGFVACAAMMAAALWVQYVQGDQPCHLCILQRYAVVTVGLLFLLAALHHPRRAGARAYAGLIVLASLAGVAVAARNLWVQMQPRGAVPACGADLDVLVQMMPLHEALATVFMAGGDCQDVIAFLGVPLPIWVILGLVPLAGWAVWWNAGRRERGAGPVRFERRH